MPKQLDVWKQSVDLVTEIYHLTQHFPSDEKFGLTNQIRRASVSIPSNIAEGAARQSDKEFLNILYIALGSCSELETQLIIAENLGYCASSESMQKLFSIKRMLQGLIEKRKGENV